MSGLTVKQQLFVDAYLECFNATEAARVAGYDGDDNSLGVIGSQNLRKLKISEIIKARLDASAMSANEALAILAEQARADIGDFIAINDKGNFVIDWDAARGKTHLVKSVKNTAHGISIELHDPQAAIDKILKAGGEYTQKVEHSAKDGQPLVFEVVYTNPPPPLDDNES